jgi:Rod binding domain-containing protein
VSTIPPINPAVLPPDVRAAGKKGEALYSDALSFENVMLQQLTQQMFNTDGSDGSSGLAGIGSDSSGDGSDDSLMSGDATSSAFTSMLPQAMADALTGAGGVGLADQLYTSFAAQYGVSTKPADPTGSTGAGQTQGASS